MAYIDKLNIGGTSYDIYDAGVRYILGTSGTGVTSTGLCLTVETLGASVSSLSSTVGSLNTTVGSLNTTVGALSTTVGNASSGLVKDVADLKAKSTAIDSAVHFLGLGQIKTHNAQNAVVNAVFADGAAATKPTSVPSSGSTIYILEAGKNTLLNGSGASGAYAAGDMFIDSNTGTEYVVGNDNGTLKWYVIGQQSAISTVTTDLATLKNSLKGLAYKDSASASNVSVPASASTVSAIGENATFNNIPVVDTSRSAVQMTLGSMSDSTISADGTVNFGVILRDANNLEDKIGSVSSVHIGSGQTDSTTLYITPVDVKIGTSTTRCDEMVTIDLNLQTKNATPSFANKDTKTVSMGTHTHTISSIAVS